MRSRFSQARLALGAACLWAVAAQAGDIYVYQTDNGSRLITDHPRVEAGYRLIKVYSESNIWQQTNPDKRVASKPRKVTPRPSSYDGLIDTVGLQAGVDPLLIKSVMQAESAFNPEAVSHKGASGLMQLMPGTAKRYGVARIFDPRENTLGGALYLSDLLAQFDGRLDLALAGYNAGENAVMARGGMPPYPETRRYVKKVMRLYQQYKNEKCPRPRGDLMAAGARIVSCSGSAPGSLGSIDLALPDTVSSAAEQQCRQIE